MKETLLIFYSLLLLLSNDAGAATIFGPVLYRQRSDSPFYAGVQTGTIVVEDFEDGQLNTPGVTARDGRVLEDQGVDEDDGSLNGLGRNNVWVGPNGTLPDLDNLWKIEIKFSPDAILGYPAFAGIALPGWTTFPPGLATQRFGAYDANNNDLTNGGLVINMVQLPNGTPLYSSEGTQFVGIHSETGISRITLFSYSFDHLQYGWAIPESGVVTLLGMVAAVSLMRRRRVLVRA